MHGRSCRLLVVMLDGLGPEFKDLPFLKTLNPKPLETYTFTYPSVYATLTGLKPKMDDFWKNGRLTREVFSWKDYNVDFLWDKLECRQLYLNVPFSYPPKKINGIMVSYGMYGLHAYPRNMEVVLKKMRYIPDVYVDDPDFISKCREATMRRTYTAVKYGGDMDFIYMAYTSSDRILHKRLEVGEKMVRNFMEYLDYNLKILFKRLNPEHYIVYSDHGFTEDGYHGPEHPETKYGIFSSDLGEIRHIDGVYGLIVDVMYGSEANNLV